MAQFRIKRGRGLIRANITPPGWFAFTPEERGRLVALVLARQAGRGDVIATSERLYAQVASDAAGVILRGEVAALVNFPQSVCPGGCGADLAFRNCECDKMSLLEELQRDLARRFDS
jgi:hypothetical protein